MLAIENLYLTVLMIIYKMLDEIFGFNMAAPNQANHPPLFLGIYLIQKYLPSPITLFYELYKM